MSRRAASPFAASAERLAIPPARREGGGLTVRHARYGPARSEEHTSELQSLMRTSYAVLSMKKTQIRRKNSDRLSRKLRYSHIKNRKTNNTNDQTYLMNYNM